MSLLVRAFSPPSLFLLIFLWLPFYALMGMFEISVSTLNICTQIGILVGCVGVALLRIAGDPVCLWYPITWFLLTSGLYYGFGPLLYYFGSPETVAFSDAYYPVTDLSLWKVNIVTLTGIGGVIAIYSLLKSTINVRGSQEIFRRMRERTKDSLFLWKVALIFMIIGITVKIFLVLPRSLGLWDVVLPGGIEYFAVLSTLAVVPLSLLSRRHGPWALAILLGLFCFELVTAYIQLSKLAILKVAIIGMLAWVLRGATGRRLIATGGVCLLIYVVILVPLVTYGRITFNVLGLTKISEAEVLIGDVISGSADERLAALNPGVQSWWSRFNYANAQAFAINAHDEDQAGNTFGLAIWTLIPRILYPEKPLTTTGSEFNELVIGNSESKSAPGMFAEGYWNAGLPGLAIVLIVMASFFFLWERYTRACVAGSKLEFLPVMWMGLFPAIQQDSWFIPGTLGIVPIAVAFHYFARLFLNRSVFDVQFRHTQ